jgi:hypothetical protein
MWPSSAGDIEDILLILGASAPADLSIAASRAASAMPGCEYRVTLLRDPRTVLPVAAPTAQALIALGAMVLAA